MVLCSLNFPNMAVVCVDTQTLIFFVLLSYSNSPKEMLQDHRVYMAVPASKYDAWYHDWLLEEPRPIYSLLPWLGHDI